MHNKIYQIELSPIVEEEFLLASYMEDCWFPNSVADKISDVVSYEECLSQLKKRLEQNKLAIFNETGNAFILLQNAQKGHFADRYIVFLEAAKKLSEASENEFLFDFRKLDNDMHNISNLFCNCFDDYVYSDEDGFIPFDEFIRTAQIGKPYYIGGIVEYH